MKELLFDNAFFGIFISLIAFKIGKDIFNKFKWPILNPIFVALILIFIFMEVFNIPTSYYNKGGDILGFFIAPATVCLAIPLYKELGTLKKHYKVILAGALIGSVTAILSVVLLGKLLGIEDIILLSFVPKSITTPIGIEVSKLLGGIPAITVFAIMVTGIAGNIFAPFMLKLFRIENAVAKGLGIGISSHAVGTSKAIEMGEVEGAMSALSIVIAGIITIFIAPLLLNFLK
ncbi:LrgB family protein [Cetobacterium somerae]|uniref:LrgB family protein n=1 Tax=Cetobacterium somerae TaxID=188913 RepID=UPI00211F157B|nr:LrgB family protein [Cetobacterium somerae]MCQ9625635.1 LrgB family protein [Cetobacterium somerae]